MIRCLLCQKISLLLICKNCQTTLLQPTFTTRILDDGFKVYSFYRYHDIASLVKTKHRYIGASIYRILAKNSFQKFSENFTFQNRVYAMGIDDHPKHGYAHTAILAKSLKSSIIKPLYHKLRAQNDIRYSGQTLAYRLAHKRAFSYHDKEDIDVIIVDDIITTGTTILEAKYTLEKAGAKPLFALTLADAREL